MTTETRHTPLPWSYDCSRSRDIDSNYGIVATVRKGETRTTWVDNAEFICRACNSHDKLLSCLKLMVEYYRHGEERAEAVYKIKDSQDAIAKAEPPAG